MFFSKRLGGASLVLVTGSLIAIGVQSLGCYPTSGAKGGGQPVAYKGQPASECEAMLGKLPGPSTNPTSQPTNNGAFASTFADDLEAFMGVETTDDGLGPVYNADSCTACHQSNALGETSQVSVIRAGHRIKDKFYEPPGGSLMFQRAIHPDIQVRVQPLDNLRSLRMTTNVLGDGFIECIPDQAILDVQAAQPASMMGTVVINPVPVGLKTVNGKETDDFEFIERIGRFGWKCQDASLLAFSAGAYLNEMGITSPLQPAENSSLGRDTAGYNPRLPGNPIQDEEDVFGEDVVRFARFMRGSNPPPRAGNLDGALVARGREVFKTVQCAICHVPDWETGGTDTDLGDIKVPAELANRPFQPYSDFLLHDVGTGDGIVQTQHAQRPIYSCREDSVKPSLLGKAIDAKKHPRVHRVIEDMYKYVAQEKDPRPKMMVRAKTAHNVYENGATGQRYMDTPLIETAAMMRTAPLWGLRARPQMMHDGLSLTVDEAIRRHANQADASTKDYAKLSDEDRCALLTFLMSL